MTLSAPLPTAAERGFVRSDGVPETAPPHHHRVVRWLHWSMALGFLFLWITGYAMRNLMVPDSPSQEVVYDLHNSIGVTVLALFVLRVAARGITRPPPLPPAFGTDRNARRAPSVTQP